MMGLSARLYSYYVMQDAQFVFVSLNHIVFIQQMGKELLKLIVLLQIR